MKKRERSHIQKYLPKLIEWTNCSNPLLIAELRSKNVLGAYDIAKLKAEKNESDKSEMFYEIIVAKDNSYGILCEALETQKQTGASGILKQLEILDDDDDSDSNDEMANSYLASCIRFNVRSPVHLFTGREEELTKLHSQLTENSDQATIITFTAAITGLGGIGKTELCRKYIEKYSKYYEGNVIWIGAEKHSEMLKSFQDLAKNYLGISLKEVDGEDKEIETVVSEVYTYFQNKKCLFVFDNAVSSEDKQLDKFLPCNIAINKKPHVLITSRDRDWDMGMPTNTLFLENLKENEAIEFIKKGLSIKDNNQDNSIKKLVKKQQFFPLVLQQAISYIQQQSRVRPFGIEKYLSLFKSNSAEPLDFNISKPLLNSYSQTTLTTWKITTKTIQEDKEFGAKAMGILNLIAYFDPDNIPAEYLFTVLNFPEDDFYSALYLLVKYSMVTTNQPQNSSVSVHRMVQEVTRIEMESKDDQDKDVIGACLRMFTMTQIKSDQAVKQVMTVFKHNINNRNIKLDISQRQLVSIAPIWVINWLLGTFDIQNKKFTLAQEAIIELFNKLPSQQVKGAKEEFKSALKKLSEGKNYEESLLEFRNLLQKFMEQEDPEFVIQNNDGIICLNHYISDILISSGNFQECLDLLTVIFERQRENYTNTPEKRGMVIKTLGQFLQLFIKWKKFGEAHQVCQQMLSKPENSDVVLISPIEFLPWPTPPPPGNLFSVKTREMTKSLCEKLLDLAKIELSWEFIGSCIHEILTPSGLLELESSIHKHSKKACNQPEMEAGVVNSCEKMLTFTSEKLSRIETAYHPKIIETLKCPLIIYLTVVVGENDFKSDEIFEKYKRTWANSKKVESNEEYLAEFRKAVAEYLQLSETHKNNNIVDVLVSLQAHVSLVLMKKEWYMDLAYLLFDLENAFSNISIIA
ncbi:unnamed protein product [Orchesella dallaii]|uniref:NB-ARC domain-containing protein n=1 Tax=Orchesella dallaii TaxID=48710 RepID=A0ABP1S1Q5_9HEXA